MEQQQQPENINLVLPNRLSYIKNNFALFYLSQDIYIIDNLDNSTLIKNMIPINTHEKCKYNPWNCFLFSLFSTVTIMLFTHFTDLFTSKNFCRGQKYKRIIDLQSFFSKQCFECTAPSMPRIYLFLAKISCLRTILLVYFRITSIYNQCKT